MRVPSLAARTLFFVLLTSLATCDSPVAPAGATLTQVEIEPQSIQIELNGSAELEAIFRDAEGNVRSDIVVHWSTENRNVAEVSPDGVVIARGLGKTRVAASAQGIDAVAEITVVPPAVASVALTPGTSELLDNGSVQLEATAYDAGFRVIEGRTVTWSSADPDIATVDQTGLVAAVAPGTTKITATVDGKSGEATIVVTARPVATVEISPEALNFTVGSTHQLKATPKAADGSPLAGRQVVWSSSNENVVTISESGLARAIAPGAVRVTAMVEGKSASANVTVSVVPVATVEISPTSADLSVLQTRQFTAVLKAQDGTILSGRTVTWSTNRPLIASVSSTGLVTGLLPGGAVITASAEGKSASASVEVRLRPVNSVDIFPTSVTLVQGEQRQFSATPRASDGAELEGREVTWSSANTAVVTVAENGLAKAVGVGTTTVRALVEGKASTAQVTVTPIPVATIEVNPPTSSITIAQTRQLTATLRAVDGTILTGRKVDWSSDPQSVAAVDASGLVTPIRVGEATITASAEGKSGTAVVTVVPRPVASVEVSPPTAVMVIGDERQFTAIARASDGTVLDGREVAWSSGDPDVAFVSDNGLVAALSDGTTTIRAAIEGRSATAQVTVVVPPVETIDIEPTSFDLVVGQERQLIATLRSVDGQAITGRSVTWSSDDPDVATVDPSGNVTARAVGLTTIRATADGKFAGATVRVQPRPVASVEVTPEADTLIVGQERQYVATARAADGTVLTGRSVLWSTSAPGVLTIDENGYAHAIATGTARVVATVESRSGQAEVLVVPIPVAAVEVSPPDASLTVSETRLFVATLRAADGSILTDREIEWSSTSPGVADVDETGLVTALSPGTTSIVATSGGVSGSAGVTVSPPPVATVEISPLTASLYVTESRPFTAVARAADGTELHDRPIVWGTTNSAFATVSQDGTVLAVGVGTTKVYAEAEGRRGDVEITVTPAPIATIDITPSSFILAPLQSRQLTVTLRAPNGSIITGRNVTWSTDRAIVASVSQTGLVTAFFPGEAVIRARAEGKEGTARVTVTGQR